jgi:maltooligosyltrehalose trehalohydrolase
MTQSATPRVPVDISPATRCLATEGGPSWTPQFGAWPVRECWHFRIWAPEADCVEVVLDQNRSRPLLRRPDGTFTGAWTGLRAGERYWYRVNGRGPYPDPASRAQPLGVHGPSQLVDPRNYRWRDDGWKNRAFHKAIIYELHVGTFTPEGTFAAAAQKLPILRDLGITAVELMPLADFAGCRNWGYDGVAFYAPAHVYGTPDDLRAFVDAAHALDIAVLLDVVYNHLGPDGAYHTSFAAEWLTPGGPWGAAINLRGEAGRMVSTTLIDNALYWLHEFHIDGLRLDATHALADEEERPFLRELVATLRERAPRATWIIAEDERNERRLLRPLDEGGCGLDAVWADDFHHQVRRHLTGERDGYYQDYEGTTEAIAQTIQHGWFYQGQHSAHKGASRGTPTMGAAAAQFVVCLQNHDQVGNRAFGDRLHHAIDLASWRAASVLLFIVPETPLLFMGQEWAASTPFRYFTDHADALGKAVSEGRRREFAHFTNYQDDAAAIPDPQALDTFTDSRLDWSERDQGSHQAIWRLYQDVIGLRRTSLPSPATLADCKARALDADTLVVQRHMTDAGTLVGIIRLRGAGRVTLAKPPASAVDVLLSTEDVAYALDSQPVCVSSDASTITVHFTRPGALLLRLSA